MLLELFMMDCLDVDVFLCCRVEECLFRVPKNSGREEFWVWGLASLLPTVVVYGRSY
jgi:hypothetical protein